MEVHNNRLHNSKKKKDGIIGDTMVIRAIWGTWVWIMQERALVLYHIQVCTQKQTLETIQNNIQSAEFEMKGRTEVEL